MELKIITPDKEMFSGKISKVRVPGSNGSFAVLKNHAPIVSTLENGIIHVEDDQSLVHEFSIKSGLIEAHKNIITILAESDVTNENQ